MIQTWSRVFAAANYQAAAVQFGTAMELDPELTAAKAYQAYAYMNQYIPGADDHRLARGPNTRGTRWFRRAPICRKPGQPALVVGAAERGCLGLAVPAGADGRHVGRCH